MARKISERERLITFVLQASVEQLTEAKELIDTALRQKSPKTKKRAPSTSANRAGSNTNRIGAIGNNRASENPPSET